MTTAKVPRIWANTVRRWSHKVANAATGEHLAQAAAWMERLVDHKPAAERQLVYPCS